MSVAELCRRLGPVPATADSVANGATPLLIGDLLRREGRPEVGPDPFAPAPVVAVPEARRAPSSRPLQDDDPGAVPVPRRRGEACKTALGAGGLVVAGSVLGAALLAAAGVGGALPVPQGDDGTGQFQGQGTLRTPGTAYGSVNGRQVVSGASLVRAVGYYLPFARTTAAPSPAPRARAAAAPLAVFAAAPARAAAPAGAAAPASPATALPQVVGQVTQTAGPATNAVAPLVNNTVAPLVNNRVAPLVTELAQTAVPVVRPLAQGLNPVVNSVAAAVAPAATALSPLRPLAQGLNPVVNSVAAAVAPAATALSPLTNNVATTVAPVLTFAAPAVKTVSGITDAQTPAGTAGSALQDATALTTSAAEGIADIAGPVLANPADSGLANRVVARSQTAAADAPTLQMPVVPSQAAGSSRPTLMDTSEVLSQFVPSQAVDSPAPLVADDSSTAPLPIVRPADEPGPSVDSPTLPLTIVSPTRPETDGRETDTQRDDGQSDDAPADPDERNAETGSSQSNGAEESETPGSGVDRLSETVGSVTGTLFGG